MSSAESDASLSDKDLNVTSQSLGAGEAVNNVQFVSLQNFIDGLRQYKSNDATTTDVQFRVLEPKVTLLCAHEAVINLTLTNRKSSQKKISGNVKVQIYANASEICIGPAEIIRPPVLDEVKQHIQEYLKEHNRKFPSEARAATDGVCSDVSTHLSRQWMNAYIATFSTVGIRDYPLDLHFFAKSTNPEVRNLCSQASCHGEIVLTFKIEKIVFSKAGNFERPQETSSDWEISCIVGFTKEEGSGKIVLHLDGARYAKCFSSYPQGSTLVGDQSEKVANFIVSHYCKILTQYSINVVQPGDVDQNQPDNFEMVVLSPCSISSRLDRLYQARDPDVTPFGSVKDSGFQVDFDCISISFVAGNASDVGSTLISVGIKSGQMNVGGTIANILPMKISFNVGISESVPNEVGEDGEYSWACLALNFDKLKPEHIKSTGNVLPAYLDNFHKNIISYLHNLSSKGFNIIYSIPAKTSTRLKYKITPGCCGQVIASGCQCDLNAKADQLVLGIVVLTETSPKVSAPTDTSPIPFSASILSFWNDMNVAMSLQIVSKDRTLGIAALKGEPSPGLIPKSERLWRYEDSDCLNRCIREGDKVSCETKTKISLDPSASPNQTLKILFNGRSKLRSNVRTTFAEWSASILINSNEHGLCVEPFINPAVEVEKRSGYEEDGDGDDLDLLEEHQRALKIGFKQMKKAFDDIEETLQDTVEDVNQSLTTGQVYSFVDPRLTNEGGLVFSLCPEPLGEDTV
ncbi:hypothetical protein QCA50_016914 [Cerrena zonata]|uniref:Uncharacterized protein n=1 Tax=Cerrena zonata TaxID=2478898 RepID=A0AAW0FR36_9APHY